jgi:hypothetical protein
MITRAMMLGAIVSALLGILNILNFFDIVLLTGTRFISFVRIALLALSFTLLIGLFFARSMRAVLYVVVPWVFLIAGVSLSVFGSGDTTATGLPRCDSVLARSEVDDAIAGAPLGRVMGISVIDYRNITTK